MKEQKRSFVCTKNIGKILVSFKSHQLDKLREDIEPSWKRNVKCEKMKKNTYKYLHFIQNQLKMEFEQKIKIIAPSNSRLCECCW